MFLFTPQNMEIITVKNEVKFQKKQLNSDKFDEYIKLKRFLHQSSQSSQVDIGSKLNYQIKNQYEDSNLSFQYCSPSNQICLTNFQKKSHDEQLWKILGNGESHKLRIGDKIKIGSNEFSVYEIQMPLYEQKNKAVEFTSKHNCKYCLENTFTNKNPLLNVCKCDGSLKFTHLECIRQWIKSNISQKKDHYTTSYKVNKLQCKKCKTLLPQSVLLQEKIEPLIRFQRQNQFVNIILETDSLDQNILFVKKFIKIKVNGGCSIGNNSIDSNIALKRYGVSPIHCSFYTDYYNVYITDRGSKAGTLIGLHEQQFFKNKNGLTLQYGSLIFNVKLEDPFFACLAPEQSYKLKYIVRNVQK